jgi:hypothetical protein
MQVVGVDECRPVSVRVAAAEHPWSTQIVLTAAIEYSAL